MSSETAVGRRGRTLWLEGWRMPAALAAAAVALRLLMFLGRGAYIAYDEGFYLLLGRSLWAGEGYTLTGLRHVALSPLFPVLAGGFDRVLGDIVWAGRIVAAVTGGLLVVPCWSIFRRLAGRRAAVFGCALVAVMPSLTPFTVPYWIRWDLWVGAEPVLHLFLYGGIALFLRALARGRASDWMLAGLLFALAYLARPEAIVVLGLLAAAAAVLAVRHRAPRVVAHLVSAGFAFALVASPYWLYLHDTLGRWALTGRGVRLAIPTAVAGEVTEGSDPARIIERMLWGDDQTPYLRNLYSLDPSGTRLRSTYWGVPPHTGSPAADSTLYPSGSGPHGAPQQGLATQVNEPAEPRTGPTGGGERADSGPAMDTGPWAPPGAQDVGDVAYATGASVPGAGSAAAAGGADSVPVAGTRAGSVAAVPDAPGTAPAGAASDSGTGSAAKGAVGAPVSAAPAASPSPDRSPAVVLRRVWFYGRALGIVVPWFVWPFIVAGAVAPRRRLRREELLFAGSVLGTSLVIAAFIAVDPRTQAFLVPLLAYYAQRGLRLAALGLERRAEQPLLRRGFLRGLMLVVTLALLLGTDLRRLYLSVSVGSPHHIVGAENRQVGRALREWTDATEPIMSWHPAIALYAQREWRVLPAASLPEIVRYAALGGVRVAVLSAYYPSPLQGLPAHYLALVLPDVPAYRARFRLEPMGQGENLLVARLVPAE